ncbi:MAG: adenine-specific DNA-methyltransferase [Promethearchaeota archaeon]
MEDILEVFAEKPEECHYNESSLIILGIALENLRRIKDNTINLIFADPPYNIGKKLLDKRMGREEYIDWTIEWVQECMRILKPTGTFYYMTATQFMPYIDSYIDSHYFVRQRIIWYYDSSGVQAKSYFGSMYEPILMITKNKKNYDFYPENIMVEAKTGARRQLIDYRKTPPQPYNTRKVMGNVWEIPRVRYLMDEYENHPTQKPTRLLQIIVKASSKRGDIVLDPFGGSFTTSYVAQRLGRKSISIEKDEEYYKIGLRRLKIATYYNGEELIKKKIRKTKNKSKKDHEIIQEAKKKQKKLL